MFDGVLTGRTTTIGVISRLDHRGHGPIAKWSHDRASQGTAERVFAEHVAKGYTLFDISHGDGTKLDKFNPEATEILAVPRMQAG